MPKTKSKTKKPEPVTRGSVTATLTDELVQAFRDLQRFQALGRAIDALAETEKYAELKADLHAAMAGER